jgi:hypothetical protein
MLLRSLSAASQSFCSKPMLAEELVFAADRGRAINSVDFSKTFSDGEGRLSPFFRGSQSGVEEFGSGAARTNRIAPAQQVMTFVGDDDPAVRLPTLS